LASSQGMKNNGKSITKILLLWLIVVAIGTISSAIGFSILANINNKDIVSIALSYASGAILVMLAESMIPEAFEEGGSKIGRCYGRLCGSICIRKTRRSIKES